MVYGVDSNFIVWAMRDRNVSARPEMERRCRAQLLMFAQEKAEVCISTISVAELLAPLTRDQHAPFLAQLQRTFHIVPFDTASTIMAAELEALRGALVVRGSGDRRLFNADRLIVASLRAGGVNRFYSDDDRCRKLAIALGMEGLEIPFDEQLKFTDPT